ncbi:MAG: hypothetical protein KME15_14090 [Drouetiella hepatica Uher 2000/2452]|jgi:hypothetical protein|uniref:Uncharacterized protein n=1 Tax=Drouetiella hepatica Uher 2000/2452 TaxID=904376 RepID=A0A951QAN8_9CYAN|nr:hypothetical protein [Drouetiella hepatica Uher 2000/2452]
MIEQITLLLATPIAKAILDKFYEGVGSKLGEKAVEMLPDKVQQLGKLMWEKCLRGKPGTDQILQQAAEGSTEAQKQLITYLHKVLESDLALKQEAQKLAAEIHLEVTNNDIQARNVQYVTGQAQGLQVNDPNQPVIQVQGNPTFHFGSAPQSD